MGIDWMGSECSKFDIEYMEGVIVYEFIAMGLNEVEIMVGG